MVTHLLQLCHSLKQSAHWSVDKTNNSSRGSMLIKQLTETQLLTGSKLLSIIISAKKGFSFCYYTVWIVYTVTHLLLELAV